MKRYLFKDVRGKLIEIEMGQIGKGYYFKIANKWNKSACMSESGLISLMESMDLTFIGEIK